MKICVPFKNKSKSSAIADELLITVNSLSTMRLFENNDIDEKYLEKHLIFSFTSNMIEKIDPETAAAFYHKINCKKKSLRLEIGKTNPFKYYDKWFTVLGDNNVNFFIDTPAVDWNDLNMFKMLPVTEVYVAEDLAFSLTKATTALHNVGKRVRIYPNVVQSKYNNLYTDYSCFFIRPEDMYLYEPFIDTLEFWGVQNNALSWINIYSKNRNWAGKLKEIIIGFHTDVDNRYIGKDFGLNRIDCGRRCIQPESKCNRCDFWIHAAMGRSETAKFVKEIEEQIEAMSNG